MLIKPIDFFNLSVISKFTLMKFSFTPETLPRGQSSALYLSLMETHSCDGFLASAIFFLREEFQNPPLRCKVYRLKPLPSTATTFQKKISPMKYWSEFTPEIIGNCVYLYWSLVVVCRWVVGPVWLFGGLSFPDRLCRQEVRYGHAFFHQDPGDLACLNWDPRIVTRVVRRSEMDLKRKRWVEWLKDY